MLSRDGFYVFDPHRAYAQILMQLPVAISLELGAQNLNFLMRAHSFGFVFVPLIFWIAALAIQLNSRLFWFILMAYCVTYLRSNFFAAGEFNITYAMTAFCASILLRHNINRSLAVLLILVSVALTHSYEMTLFLGALLSGLAAWRLWRGQHDSRLARYCIAISIVFFVASIYVGFQSAFFDRSYDGRSTANLNALREIHFLYLLAMPPLVAAFCLTTIVNIRKALIVIAFFLSILYGLYTARWDQTNISFGYLSYAYRALVGLLLVGIILLAAIATRGNRPSSWLGIIVTFFFLSLSFPMLTHTYGFYQWIKRFEIEAIGLQHHTYINETTINRQHGLNSGYNWPWGNSYTSILLRGNVEAIILNSSQYQSTNGSCYEDLGRTSNQLSEQCQAKPLFPFLVLKKDGRLFP
jgi:hypothetical protein